VTAEQFRDRLLAEELLADGAVPGIYHRSFALEHIIQHLSAYISAAGEGTAMRRLHLGPVQARATLEGSGYVTSFPNLVGVVTSFSGTEADVPGFLDAVEAGGSWLDHTAPTDLALCSAGCHPLYPMLASSVVPTDGELFEVETWVFRHEPSVDPARMQTFRQHEFVCVGSLDQAVAHRDRWLERGRALLAALALELDVVPANDPFFGRPGRLLARSQLAKELKFELTAPISSSTPGAVASANYHEDHFGVAYAITTPDGAPAHTACIGFGLERIALSLLYTHGTSVSAWPTETLAALSIDPATLAEGSR